jgi:preprotein translocase subunit SecA
MDYLREGVHLRAFAQKDPLVEYRGEGHAMFEELGQTIRSEVVFTLFHVAVEVEEPALEPMQAREGALHYEHETSAGADVIAAAGSANAATALAAPSSGNGGSFAQAPAVNEHKDLGRNDPCWCGSGKKYKRCHGA